MQSAKHVPQVPRKDVGVLQLRRKFPQHGQTPSLPSDLLDELPHSSRIQRHLGSPGQLCEGSPSALGQQGVSDHSNSNAHSSFLGIDDRCFSVWMERFSASSLCSGPMVDGCVRDVHELERTEVYSSFPGPLCPSSSRSVCQHPVRQHDSIGMSSSSRIFSCHASADPDKRDPSVLSVSEDYPSSHSPEGGAECAGGSGIEIRSNLHRMDPGQTVLSPPLQCPGDASSGPVCHQVEHSVGDVCLSMSRQVSSRIRRIQLGLESLEVNIPLSSISSIAGSSTEAAVLPGHGLSGSSNVAHSQLVQPPHEEVPQCASSSGRTSPVSRHRHRPSVLSKFEGFEASRLRTIEAAYRRDGFDNSAVSIMMAKHRKSTSRQYQSTWKSFLDYLSVKDVPHTDVTLATVFGFLAYRAQTGLGYRTISTYRCALVDPLRSALGLLIDTPESEAFMRGLFNSNPPKRKAPLPEWNLEVLLRFLASKTFEPLDMASWDLVLQMTLALILLASGRRICEVANISRNFNVKKGRVFLHWLPSFMAKNESKDFRAEFPSISSMDTESSQDQLLCPVRAWKIFKDKRPADCPPDSFWGIDTRALSARFISLVTDARKSVGLSGKISTGPHQMRKLAASYGMKFLCSSVDDQLLLAKRMGWASLSVLKKAYLDNVPELGISCVVPLGTITGNM